MISQVHSFMEHLIDVGNLFLTCSLPAVLQHTAHNPGSPFTVLVYFLQADPDLLCQLFPLFIIGGFFQFINQIQRAFRKVIDEVQRILYLMRDTGSKLAKRSHLLRLYQLILCGP